jgi:hypothetical protein
VAREQLLGEVSTALAGARIQNTWRGAAALIYRNWLEHLRMRKRFGGDLEHAAEWVGGEAQG